MCFCVRLFSVRLFFVCCWRTLRSGSGLREIGFYYFAIRSVSPVIIQLRIIRPRAGFLCCFNFLSDSFATICEVAQLRNRLAATRQQRPEKSEKSGHTYTHNNKKRHRKRIGHRNCVRRSNFFAPSPPTALMPVPALENPLYHFVAH